VRKEKHGRVWFVTGAEHIITIPLERSQKSPLVELEILGDYAALLEFVVLCWIGGFIVAQ